MTEAQEPMPDICLSTIIRRHNGDVYERVCLRIRGHGGPCVPEEFHIGTEDD